MLDYCFFPTAGLPINKKTHLYNICTMLDQRRRRWADIVQMLYKCFIFAVVGTSEASDLAQ